jgi:hypothetical protein
VNYFDTPQADVQILALTPELFNEFVLPRLRDDLKQLTLEAYQLRFPDVTHIIFATNYRGKRVLVGIGKPNECPDCGGDCTGLMNAIQRSMAEKVGR